MSVSVTVSHDVFAAVKRAHDIREGSLCICTVHMYTLLIRHVEPSKGPGGCGEAALGGDADGAGDRSPESQTGYSRGAGEGTGGLQGQSAPNQ